MLEAILQKQTFSNSLRFTYKWKESNIEVTIFILTE